MKKLYVAPNGSDQNEGSSASPFATPEKALETAKALKSENADEKVEIIFKDGCYRTNGLVFDGTMSGISLIAENKGKAVLSGGISIPGTSFRELTDAEKERMIGDKDNKIRAFDLASLGLTKEDIGEVFGFGAYFNGDRYGYAAGNNIEVFENDERMTLARYPNHDFTHTERLVGANEKGEYEEKNFYKVEHPEGYTFYVNTTDAEHIKKWKDPLDAWLFGYPMWDWADSCTLMEEVDADTGRIKTKFAHNFGIRNGANFYFFNVPEELDERGEYYIDRKNLILYVYPGGKLDTLTYSLSLCTNHLIKGENVRDIRIDGLCLCECRNDAVVMTGADHVTVENCLVKNVYGWAMRIEGNNTLVRSCEIFGTGKGGVSLVGGDRKTLEHGNCSAENNYIHDWSKVYLTYNPAIRLDGCGLKAAHNELCRTPHAAILYEGNDILIEYNYIHETVQQSNDAGAIYAGRTWTTYGDVVRYNLIENTGNDRYFPVAIYWDDTLAGQTAYGNIIKRCSAKGFLIGGGQNNTVYNNIIIDCGECSILFDQRGRDSIIGGSWWNGVSKEGVSGPWRELIDYNVKEPPYSERYPELAKVSNNYDDFEDPSYGANPGNGKVNNNLLIYNSKMAYNFGLEGCLIYKDTLRMSNFEGNAFYRCASDCLKGCSYELKEETKKLLPDFKPIPVDKIGRDVE